MRRLKSLRLRNAEMLKAERQDVGFRHCSQAEFLSRKESAPFLRSTDALCSVPRAGKGRQISLPTSALTALLASENILLGGGDQWGQRASRFFKNCALADVYIEMTFCRPDRERIGRLSWQLILCG